MRCKDHIPFILVLFLALFLTSTKAFGQAGGEARVIATLDPPKILIGEEATLSVRVAHPKGKHVELTLPKDTLVTGVEIKRVELADSVAVTEAIEEYVFHVTLTSFDSARYTLRNISAVVGGVTVTTDDLPVLIVGTVPVDVDHPERFADLKDQWNAALQWRDYIWSFIAVILFVLVLVAGYFVAKRYLSRRKAEPGVPLAQPPLRDPYEEAVEGIQELKADGLTEEAHAKEYYTRMTDILRHFIYRVYGIETAEKTSSEITEAFHSLGGKEKELAHDLSRILTTADWAKFAKYVPSRDENINLWQASLGFVEEVHHERDKAEKEAETTEEEGGGKTV